MKGLGNEIADGHSLRTLEMFSQKGFYYYINVYIVLLFLKSSYLILGCKVKRKLSSKPMSISAK
jgi:hypothetical protein